MVNIPCICFVFWKSTECLIKFFDKPQGTQLVIEHPVKINNFPSFSICGYGKMRWNESYLKNCGIGYVYKLVGIKEITFLPVY